MAEKKETSVLDETEVLEKVKGFWDKFSKPILYVGSAIILLIGGWFSYKYFVKIPKEKKGNEAVFMAENLFGKMSSGGFNKDSAAIVLNGGLLEGIKVNGVLSVIKNFDGTEAANRANYIAGATYLHIKEYAKAIKYLKEFSANGAYQIESKANILLGHAYAEQNKQDDALSYYKKAADLNVKDDITTAEALNWAAGYADAIGKSEEAIKLYQRLKDECPSSGLVRNGDVDKCLARLGVLK